MGALGRGEASNCTNPKLDVFMRLGGVLVDIYSLEFEIYEKVSTPSTPVKVFPSSGRQAVVVGTDCPVGERLSTGHYVATYSVPNTALVGTHEIRWYFRLTATTAEQEFREEFEVLPVLLPSSGAYCTVQEFRDEGVPDASTPGGYSDDVIQRKILRFSRLVDRFTQRWFEPRNLTFKLDGTSSPSLLLEHPIISVNSVTVEETGSIDATSIVVYNRHLSQNLLNPDDRENPRIEIVQPLSDDLLFKIGLRVFPAGQQNIEVDGVFGYTAYDGSSTGKTPDDICEVVKLLVMRDLPKKWSQKEAADDATNAWRVRQLRTRDQSITYADPGAGGSGGVRGQGAFTGDPTIDSILAMYAAPPRLRSV